MFQRVGFDFVNVFRVAVTVNEGKAVTLSQFRSTEGGRADRMQPTVRQKLGVGRHEVVGNC